MNISDDDLLLFYWQDGLDAETTRRIRQALAQDSELAARYACLAADLARLAELREEPADELATARLQGALRKHQATRAAHGRHWLAAAAALAALAWLPNWKLAPGPQTETPIATQERSPDRAWIGRSVRVQLAEHSAALAVLDAQPEATRRALVARWIAEQAALAEAAEAAGDHQLARTLRAFEPLLRELEAGTAEASPTDRAQLAFEWSVMQTKLDRPSSKALPSGI